MTPFFSIIIPVYNVAPYLRECLDSVVAQTFGDWEAICVDDGSTDGSGSILDEYAAKDERFKVIHQANAGVSAARNAGILASEGTFVSFLDGDDIIDVGWLAEAKRIMAETDADIVRLMYTKFTSVPRSVKLSRNYTIYDGAATVKEWGFQEFSENGYSCLVFMERRKLVSNPEHEFPAGMKFMEDNIFMLKNITYFCKAVQGEFAGYYYRVRQDSASRVVLGVKLFERIFIEAKMLIDKFGVDVVVEVNRMLQNVILVWRRTGDRGRPGADNAISIMISEMVYGGYLKLSEVSYKWRLGYEVIVRFHSFCIMDFLYAVQQMWGWLRGLLVARI